MEELSAQLSKQKSDRVSAGVKSTQRAQEAGGREAFILAERTFSRIIRESPGQRPGRARGQSPRVSTSGGMLSSWISWSQCPLQEWAGEGAAGSSASPAPPAPFPHLGPLSLLHPVSYGPCLAAPHTQPWLQSCPRCLTYISFPCCSRSSGPSWSWERSLPRPPGGGF